MDVVLDNAKVESFRREYLALMKALPRVTDFDSATALRKSFREWSDAFEKFIYRDLIGDLKQDIRDGMVNKDWGNSWEKRIRETVWDLVIQRPPIDLEDSYNTKEMQYARYLRDVKSFESRSRRYARETWKILNDFVEWYENQTGKKTFTVHVPETQKFTIAGFDVTFIGLDTIENDRDKHFGNLSDAFKRYREKAGSVFPLLLQKQLPFIVDYKHEGAFSVGAEYEGNHITIVGWSMESDVDKIVHVIAHEMAHHIWYTVLSNEDKNLWESAVNGDLGTLDLREVVKKYNPKDGWILHTENIKNSDPVLLNQLGGLQYSLGVPRELKDAYHVQDLIDYLNAGGEPILNVHTRPISGYANKSVSEAFAEAIGMLVAFGSQSIGERIRSVLKQMLPSLKIASAKTFISKHKVQGESHMNRIKVASRLLKLARHLVSMEFDTDEEMKKYKQEHDVRPGTKLTVKKTEGGKISIPEKNKPTNKTEHRKTDDAFWNSPKKSTMDIGSDAVTVDKQVYPDGSFSVHPTVQNGRYGIDNTMREMQFDKSDEKTVRDLLNEHLAGGETMGGLYVPKFESVINLRNKLKKLDISHLYQES